MNELQLNYAPVATMDTSISKGTKTLLVSGIVAGPLFIVVVLIQAFTRQGFDLVRLPLSLRMRRRLYPDLGGTWGAFLVGIYGAGLIAAGVFPPDPALGFPPGTVQGVPSMAQSEHSLLHGYAFDIAFLSLIVACFVFTRRFAALRRWGWAAYCAVTGVVTPALIVLGFANAPIMGVLFFGAGAITMGWLALVAVRLLAE